MSGHTPGPWAVLTDIRTDRDRNGYVDGPEYISGYNIIATDSEVVSCEGILSDGEANAHLIAAAPDLLDQLRAAVIQLEMAFSCIEAGRLDEALLHCGSMMRSKKAAIAKATGVA
jgi:hypothetical protein